MPARDARHAVQVLRLRPGDPLILFDGRGREAVARIIKMKAGRVTLLVDPPYESTRRPPRIVAVAGALPKGRRAAVLVEKLSELGLSRLIPVAWERGQARAAAARLKRVAEASAAQCGRADVMEIAAEASVDEALALAGAFDQAVVADPEADAPLAAALKPGSVLAYIGPEGGFTPAERERLIVAATPVRLAPTILRVETAAMALVAGIWALG